MNNMKATALLTFLLMPCMAICQKKNIDKNNILSKENIIESIYEHSDLDNSYTNIAPYDHYKLVILINDVLRQRISFYQAGQTVVCNGDSIAFLPIGMIHLLNIELYLEIWKIKFHHNKAVLYINLVNETPLLKNIVTSKKVLIR